MRTFYLITLLLIGNLSVAQTTTNESKHGIFQFRVHAFGVARSTFKQTFEDGEPIKVRFLKYGGVLEYGNAIGLQFGLGTSLLYNNLLDQKAHFQHYASFGYVLGKHSWQNTPQVQLGITKGMLDQELQSYASFAWQVSKRGIIGKHELFICPQFDWFSRPEKYGKFYPVSSTNPQGVSEYKTYEFRRINFSATIGIVFNLGK